MPVPFTSVTRTFRAYVARHYPGMSVIDLNDTEQMSPRQAAVIFSAAGRELTSSGSTQRRHTPGSDGSPAFGTESPNSLATSA